LQTVANAKRRRLKVFTAFAVERGAAEQLEVVGGERPVHPDELGMSSGDKQTQKREVRGRTGFEEVRVQVGMQVVHRNERERAGPSPRLRKRKPHGQRPLQSGAAGTGDGIHVVRADTGLRQGGVPRRHKVYEVCPTREFRHDAPIAGMDFLRRRDV
jgi:hypothetical protein